MTSTERISLHWIISLVIQLGDRGEWNKLMELEALQRFVIIAEEGSYRAAARKLYVAQPTLSRQIRSLETELMVRLFDRGRWGLSLTPDGERLLPRARRIVADAGKLRSVARGEGEWVVRVGAAATAAGSFLAPFLSYWSRERRNMRLQLVEDGSFMLRGRLERGECDLALVPAPVPDGFAHRHVKTVWLQALFPPGHPLGYTDQVVRIEELAEFPILLNSPSFLAAQLFRSACQIASIEPEFAFESSVGQTLAALAENGAGVAVVSETVDLRGFDLVTRRIADASGSPLQFALHLVWPKLDPIPGIQELVDEMSRFIALQGSGIMSRRSTDKNAQL